eukprot:CAMPEP_0170152950 /NCGR_PEP_ID=MMETSP0033_2-20121228/53941_1 /TAXON_ID=195969 /ORGANISM="Dolichomastix tenuilepis, Strain CCMP3274" /LENGTH=109 /DNA_ID=CAMNT_0010390133 /DNA_START=35 /DNA_END=364 /DNA_ORIENTATION=+
MFALTTLTPVHAVRSRRPRTTVAVKASAEPMKIETPDIDTTGMTKGQAKRARREAREAVKQTMLKTERELSFQRHISKQAKKSSGLNDCIQKCPPGLPDCAEECRAIWA